MAEAKKACEILKARPAFAGQIDGKAIVDPAHYEQFHRLLEAEQPDVVFTHWPIDNHADHRAISLLVYEAWLRMGKKFALYYYEVSNGEDTVQFTPTHYVDITGTQLRKRAACYAHASQAPDKFYALQEMVTRMRGIESGHQAGRGLHPACPKPRLCSSDGLARGLRPDALPADGRQSSTNCWPLGSRRLRPQGRAAAADATPAFPGPTGSIPAGRCPWLPSAGLPR